MRIYVVEDDHVILYAGSTLSEAKKGIRGGNQIDVWEQDVWLGTINGDGDWVFQTKYHPDNTAKMKETQKN